MTTGQIKAIFYLNKMSRMHRLFKAGNQLNYSVNGCRNMNITECSMTGLQYELAKPLI